MALVPEQPARGPGGLRYLIATVLALLLHLALLWWIGPQRTPPRDAEVRHQALRIELRQLPAPVLAESEPESAHQDYPARRPRRVAKRPARGGSASAVAAEIASDPTVEPSALGPAPVPSAPPAVRLRRVTPGRSVEDTPGSLLQRVLALDRPGLGLSPGGLATAADRHVADPVPGQAGAQLEQRAEFPLRRRPGGGYFYRGPRFQAEILPDGSVQFSDGQALPELSSPVYDKLRSLALGAMGVDAGPGQADAGDPLHAYRAEEQIHGLGPHRQGPPLQPLGRLTAPADLTDLAMRAAGQDPYAAVKQCFLDETALLRASMVDRWHSKAQARGLAHLEATLCEVWADETLPQPRRRATLFELWDECRDDPLGRDAQALIERFIREHLPAGSAQAFAAVELGRLNARRSHPRPFTPYDG